MSNWVGSEIAERDCERVVMGDKTYRGFCRKLQESSRRIGGESFIGHLRGENGRLNWGMHSKMRNTGDDWNGMALWPGL